MQRLRAQFELSDVISHLKEGNPADAMGDESQAGPSSLRSSESRDKIVKISPEDYTLDTKDFTSVKIICLGDSAVGKSK